MTKSILKCACQYISKTFVKENDNGEVNGLIIAGHNFPLSFQRDSHENLDRKGSLKHYQKVHSSNTKYHQKNWGILFKSSKRQWEWKSERKYDSLSHFILPSAARLSRESFFMWFFYLFLGKSWDGLFYGYIRISRPLVAFAHPQDFAKSSNFAAEVMKLFKILYWMKLMLACGYYSHLKWQQP